MSNRSQKNSLTPIQEEIKSNPILVNNIGGGLAASFLKRDNKNSSGKVTDSIKKGSPSTSKKSTSLKEESSKPSLHLKPIKKNSLLYKNFAFRNVDSLDRALNDEEKKLLQLYLAKRAEQNEYGGFEGESIRSHESSFITATSETKVSDSKSQTESTASSTSLEASRLKYLMGLPLGGEEEGAREAKSDIEKDAMEEQIESGESEAMKQAQRYLRGHKIFEFFQFIIVHLLGELPENPIEFILDLLDKCIIFRAGMGPPPILYEKKHIEALFYLMDRMRTDYIDKQQYYTGMKTLGICSYNPNPPTTKEGLIHKDYFMEEAYENMVCLLSDLIKRRWIYVNSPPHQMKTPPPTPQFSNFSGPSDAKK